MKSRNWKVIAEFIGITAIVASLVFVGVQLRQEQKIALVEVFEASESSAAVIDIAISEYADIWLKSKNSETLSEAESIIVNRLVATLYRRVRAQTAMRRYLGLPSAAEIKYFAIELHENPGARRIWEEQANRDVGYLKIMASDSDFMPRYRDEVLDELAKLESMND